MRIALDTNRYTDLARGVPEVMAVVANAPALAVPFCVLGEIRAGFRGGRRRDQNERELTRFLTGPIVGIVYPDLETVGVWSVLSNELRQRGKATPHNDIWIAAICIQHGLKLYSRDKHFDTIAKLMRA